MDDPDSRLSRSQPARGPLLQACARRVTSRHRGAVHDELDPEHVEHLLGTIGEGLALCELNENATPAASIRAMSRFIDDARQGKRRTPRDPEDAVLALACLYGHQLCRELAWGWGYLRRAPSPGIVLISPGFRYVIGPRHFVEDAIARGGVWLLRHQQRLQRLTKSRKNPSAELYERVQSA